MYLKSKNVADSIVCYLNTARFFANKKEQTDVFSVSDITTELDNCFIPRILPKTVKMPKQKKREI